MWFIEGDAVFVGAREADTELRIRNIEKARGRDGAQGASPKLRYLLNTLTEISVAARREA